MKYVLSVSPDVRSIFFSFPACINQKPSYIQSKNPFTEFKQDGNNTRECRMLSGCQGRRAR